MSGSPLAQASACAPHVVLKLRPAGVSPSRGHRRRSTQMAMEAFKPDVAQAVLGLAAQPVMWWSLYVLKTTGCGLPAGPYGLFGALEGVSYLIVAGFVLASLYSKATTGSGLPAGRGGVLGLAEGISFLTATAGLVVFGFQVLDYGYIPNAVPVEGGVCS
mmetsp:Transcript_6627/g.14692  ORF Transcript_6627/g.14692 Transcript_6627/m.14692 type:complete len:160 (-) Transcript_6627:341-820(-)